MCSIAKYFYLPYFDEPLGRVKNIQRVYRDIFLIIFVNVYLDMFIAGQQLFLHEYSLSQLLVRVPNIYASSFTK